MHVKEFMVEGVPYKVQFNPARIVSSGAKVDAKTIRERRCFLCPANLPPQQRGIPFLGHYNILVNPFPIFPRHLTIPELAHVEQRIAPRFGDMLQLAKALTDYTIFYNGPRCGASAPDHAHFQAGNRGFMTIESDWQKRVDKQVAALDKAVLWQLNDRPRATFVLESPDADAACRLFDILYHALPVKEGEEEPMMNLLAMYEENRWLVFIFPRFRHRPSCYTAEGDANLLCSPASVDMGGVFILPLEKDFLKITAQDISRMLAEVCLPAEDCEEIIKQVQQQTL